MWQPGTTIVHHEVWNGRVWAARPLLVVDDTPERLLLWTPQGTVRQVPATPPHRPDADSLDERILQNLSLGDWAYREHRWDVSSLWILRPGDWHSIWVSWRDGRHYGWYVNLQHPFRRTAAGIEAMDYMLDVVVDPDLSWRWKDDAQFEDMLERGVLDRERGERVRREALDVIARVEAKAPPFCEPWPDWRPDPSWSLPVLPAGWDRVPE